MMILMMWCGRLKNGTPVKNSSEYMIKHTANLPDYTTNTLSFVQVIYIIITDMHLNRFTYNNMFANMLSFAQSSLTLNISAWTNGLVSSLREGCKKRGDGLHGGRFLVCENTCLQFFALFSSFVISEIKYGVFSPSHLSSLSSSPP